MPEIGTQTDGSLLHLHRQNCNVIADAMFQSLHSYQSHAIHEFVPLFNYQPIFPEHDCNNFNLNCEGEIRRAEESDHRNEFSKFLIPLSPFELDQGIKTESLYPLSSCLSSPELLSLTTRLSLEIESSPSNIPSVPVSIRRMSPPLVDSDRKPNAITRKDIVQQRVPTCRFKASEESFAILQEHFDENPYPSRRPMALLAGQLNMQVFQVKNWFQNRRAKLKAMGVVIKKRKIVD